MSRHVFPYVGASTEAMASGTLQEGPNAGKAVTVTVYRDVASHGTVPTRWYEVCAPEIVDERGRGFRQCWRRSGKSFAEPLSIFARDVESMKLTVHIATKVD